MTTIGTPFSSSATKVLLCGAGELGKEVAIEFQRFGCEVIALDRYDNAPAMQVADRSYTLSMLDGGALEKIIKDEKAVSNTTPILLMGNTTELSRLVWLNIWIKK